MVPQSIFYLMKKLYFHRLLFYQNSLSILFRCDIRTFKRLGLLALIYLLLCHDIIWQNYRTQIYIKYCM